MSKPCPSCHQLNPSDAAFCLNCSARLIPSAVGATPRTEWPQAGMGGPMASQAQGDKASQRAVVGLVMAIAGLFCCGFFVTVPAAIVGWLELEAIKSGRAPAAGKWMAQAALWVGIGGTLIHIVLFVVYIMFAMMASANPYAY